MNTDNKYIDFDFESMAEILHENGPDNSNRKAELLQKNKLEYEQCEKTWNILSEMKEIDDFNTDNAWTDLYKRLDSDNLLNEKTAKVFKLRKIIAVAASIVLLIGFAFVIRNYVQQTNITFENLAAQVKIIDLPDGSKVYLNQYASINYPKNFNESERNVSLKGEGFFEIERDTTKPFVVNVGGAEVIVLGTSFNVKESNNNELEVTVKTGKVKFCDCADSGENIILMKGEKGLLNTNGLNKIANNEVNYLGWKNKKLRFKATPLPIVIRDINASYHSNIQIKDSEINSMFITTTFDSLSLNELLESIALTLNIRVEQNGENHILVMP